MRSWTPVVDFLNLIMLNFSAPEKHLKSWWIAKGSTPGVDFLNDFHWAKLIKGALSIFTVYRRLTFLLQFWAKNLHKQWNVQPELSKNLPQDFIKVESWVFFIRISLSHYALCIHQTLMPKKASQKLAATVLRITLNFYKSTPGVNFINAKHQHLKCQIMVFKCQFLTYLFV